MTFACATAKVRRRSLQPHQFGRGRVPGTMFRLVVHGLNVVAEVVVHPAPETEHVVGASGMDFTVATPRSGETGGEAARPTPSFDQTGGLGRRHLFEQRHRMGEGGVIQKERSVLLQWLLCLPVEFSRRYSRQAMWGNGTTTTINKHVNWSERVRQGVLNGTDHDETVRQLFPGVNVHLSRPSKNFQQKLKLFNKN